MIDNQPSFFVLGPRAFLVLALGILLGSSASAQTFTDRAAAEGMTFTHTAVLGDMPMGAGGAFGDYNGDGELDIYLANRIGSNALFENTTGNPRFVDRAVEFGIDDPSGEGTGALFGDYDNDGDPDLYLLTRGANIFWSNDGPDSGGGWKFKDVTGRLRVAAFGRSSAACYGDFDNDGYLDLYVSSHSYPLQNPQPDDLRQDYLYHNTGLPSGARIFRDWSKFLNTAFLSKAAAHSVAFVDVDDDLDLDLFVINEDLTAIIPTVTGQNFLWRNNGPDGPDAWRFSNISIPANMDYRGAPMGIAIGDIDNDGVLEIATSDAGPNHLYRRTGPGQFVDVAVQRGIDRPMTPGGDLQISWGMSFIDCDLDGYEDLYVACGYFAGTQVQPNALFMNNGSPNYDFADVSSTCGADVAAASRCAVKGDYDGDGDEDLLVVSLGDDAHLFRNEQPGGDYLGVDLVGTQSNRDGIGAIVRISTTEIMPNDQWRMIQSGSSTGGGQALRATFGVTGATVVDAVQVQWPSGAVSIVKSVAPNQVIRIVEPPATLGAPPTVQH